MATRIQALVPSQSPTLMDPPAKGKSKVNAGSRDQNCNAHDEAPQFMDNRKSTTQRRNSLSIHKRPLTAAALTFRRVTKAKSVMGILQTLPIPTQVFLAFIGILFVAFHLKYNERTAIYGPTILTTTGILATFVGISLGLAQFDSTQIDRSVPELLAGLRTAFLASVFGVFGALTLKLRQFFFAKQADAEHVPQDVTAGDLALLLRGIHQALVGQDESTLVSQLKLSRQDANDRLDALKKAQQEALQKLSEMSSKAVVEALRDVIRDFNQKITEQFGENFKHLNLAVGKLLEWQQTYKAEMEASAVRHEKVVATMQIASDHYSTLVDKAESFTRVSTDLSTVLEGLETQRVHLAAMLEGLANLLRAASGSLPQIEKKMLDLTQQLTNAVTQSQQEVGRALSENSVQIRSTLAAANQEMLRNNQEMNRQVAELIGKTKEQVLVLDKALSEELQKSLESLGRQLAALSEKFVSDYMPLTNRLREIVQLGRAA
jgi:hypothetical protein